MGKIVAIGGVGPSDKGFDGTDVIDKEIIKLSGKKRPLVLFVPTASMDSEKYCKMFQAHYGQELGCMTDLLLLYKDRREFEGWQGLFNLKKKIEQADIIYVGGGNTLKMMNLWRKLKVDKLLVDAYKKGKVLCGVSAGAICWFKHGVSDSRHFKNPGSHAYIRVSGLGLIDKLFCPHIDSFNEDKGWRSKGLKLISKKTPGVAVAVQDLSAAVIIDGKWKIIDASKGQPAKYKAVFGKAFKVYWKNGEYFKVCW